MGKFGELRLGFNANGANANVGTGLLLGTVTGNGTGAAFVLELIQQMAIVGNNATVQITYLAVWLVES